MSHTCSEYSLVEQPTIQFFAEMGKQTVLTINETLGVGGMIDNETKS